MGDDTANPFYDPGDRKYRRTSNSRGFFDDPEPEPSPNNPFYDNPPRPGVYRRGGYQGQKTNGHSGTTNREELFGGETEPKPKSFFDDDDDEFDVDAPFDAEAYRQKLLRRKIKESANRQIDSQQRSLMVIEDSEQMGVTTAEALSKQGEQLDNIEFKTAEINDSMTPRAYSLGPLSLLTGGHVLVSKRNTRPRRKSQRYESSSESSDEYSDDSDEDDEELLRQREQLDNVERKTGEINKTMDVSEKHVNKLSSIFGGLRGWFRKKEEPEAENAVPERDSRLRDTVDAYHSNVDKNQHPAVRRHDDVEARQSSAHAPGQEQMTSRQLFQQYDDQFNSNLDMMSDGLARLKGLGLVMQTEIETQNEQVERINQQVSRADDKVVQQTKRINNMLKK